MISSLLLLAATYVNPVLHMDFSDPDACIGADGKAYLTASSFGGLPGLPILASDDLVNWRYVSYALKEEPFATEGPEHGNSVWAPSIRYRADKGEYVIYWGDPDRGAFRVSAKSPEGPWSEPRLVVPAKGLIDTCPLYDDDGRVYLVNGWANSRAGMNSVLTVRELDADETKAISAPVMVYDGVPEGNFTTEGPKFYKKDGEYWLFFPSGGVGGGWQVAARAKSVYGPYETKTVLAQGKTNINGPHQGAAVFLPRSVRALANTESMESQGTWHFLHFSDRDAYGRVVYLEPMTWEKGAWPVIGDHGEPVATGEIPNGAGVVGRVAPRPPQAQRKFAGLAVSDEFDTPTMGLQWQFLGKSSDLAAWATPYGYFRLYSTAIRPVYGEKKTSLASFSSSGLVRSLWNTPNLMVQKFPAANFTATLKAQVGAKQPGEEAGLIVQGRSYARIGLRYRCPEPKKGKTISDDDKVFDVVYVECPGADRGAAESVPRVLATIPATVIGAGLRSAQVADVYLRVEVREASATTRNDQLCPPPVCTFGWSADGTAWQTCDTPFEAVQGKWIGATFGLYAISEPDCKDRGWIDADWLHVE